MTPQEFDFIWKRIFPKSIPLPHLFRQDYSSDWFRIKSLPNSKRYPVNDKETEALLERQNTIITDVFGNHAKIIGITGEYCFDKEPGNSNYLKSKSLRGFSFVELNPINLYEISRTEFKAGDTYRLYLTEMVWENGHYDNLLEAIAFDEARMFFMSAEKKCLVAPYDGGIDFVITNPALMEQYASKYKDWLVKLPEYKF